MLVVTNFPGFPERWSTASGRQGRSVAAWDWREFLRCSRGVRDAVLLVNCDPGLVMRLAAVFRAAPFLKKPLVAVDLVVRRPQTLAARLVHPFKAALLRRADRYIHYFRDIAAIEDVYRFGREKTSFVPFKPNLWPRRSSRPAGSGEYILCAGRSLRDFDTFFQAVAALPYPAAIARPNVQELRAHGARFTVPLDHLPSNVQILEDDGSDAALSRMLDGARIVVLPVLKKTLVASGISTALNAMLFGKCVIGSEGPGMSDVFGDAVLTVEPENAVALSAAIRRAWEDHQLRTRIAAAGYRYAMDLGGTEQLYARILEDLARWQQHSGNSAPPAGDAAAR